ncbi:MAG: hypothetical protein WCK32_04980 [Chlorobiaceae bacterium]
MKQWVIKIVITLLAFLCFSFVMPFFATHIEQWPAWLKNSHVQFLLNLIVAVIFGFNPATTSFIHNSLKINGKENKVKQGTKSAVSGLSATNKARIKGNSNKVEQG